MKNDKYVEPDAVYVDKPKKDFLGKPRLDSGEKVYPSNNFADKTFNKIRNTGLERSNNRMLGGVCGMVAERTPLSATMVRIIVGILTIVTFGATVLIYGSTWALLSDKKGRIPAQDFKHGKTSPSVVGSFLMMVIGLVALFWTKIITFALWAALGAMVFFALKYLASSKRKSKAAVKVSK
ncbi:MAG: PspC domain-containing protein [Micrococcaceae bacterium]